MSETLIHNALHEAQVAETIQAMEAQFQPEVIAPAEVTDEMAQAAMDQQIAELDAMMTPETRESLTEVRNDIKRSGSDWFFGKLL
jgi:hypothetical protein